MKRQLLEDLTATLCSFGQIPIKVAVLLDGRSYVICTGRPWVEEKVRPFLILM